MNSKCDPSLFWTIPDFYRGDINATFPRDNCLPSWQFVVFQCGRQETVRWLVEKTGARERLASREGERCLLHTAARYGQVGQNTRTSLVRDPAGLVGCNDSQISGINMTQPAECQARGVPVSTVQSPWLGHTHTWNMFGWSADLVHVLDNDCQLLYKYFHIFSAVKQNNEQMRKSQSLTSWDEFPLRTVLEISHHASLQAGQTWKYFNSRRYFYENNLTINVWKVVECLEGFTNVLTSMSRLPIHYTVYNV